MYTFGYRAFDYTFSTVRNAEEEKGPKSKPKKYCIFLGWLTLPRLVLVKCIVATGLVGVDILIVLLAGKKKAWSILGLGLSLVLTST